jgi:hypothetical protein
MLGFYLQKIQTSLLIINFKLKESFNLRKDNDDQKRYRLQHELQLEKSRR